MPQYIVTAPNGKEIEIDGPNPPSEAILRQIFAQIEQQQPTAQPPDTPAASWGDTAKDVAIGAAKGVGNTAFGLGKMVRDYTPVGRISDAIMPGAFDQRPPEITPTNTAQKVGFHGEQLGEFFLPTGAVSRVGKAVAELGKSGLATKAQTGDTGSAAVAMGLTAAVPGGAALAKAGKGLRQGAVKNVVQAITGGGGKEKAKNTAARIAPEMLERGVGGSREGLQARAVSELDQLGPQIGAAEQAAVAAGKSIPGNTIRGELQFAKEGLMVPNASGAFTPVPGSEAVIRKLDKMDAFVASLGPDIPFDKALKIRRAWDRIVDKGGLYGPKATSSATDNANAWATREGAGAFRTLLNEASPDLAKLNQEYRFWKGLKDVVTETIGRKQSHGAGLVANTTGAVGMVTGAASGDGLGDSLEKAFTYGVAGRQVIKLLQSPTWRTKVSAPLKFKLGTAMASGKADEIQKVARHIIESLPSQFRPTPEPSPIQ